MQTHSIAHQRNSVHFNGLKRLQPPADKSKVTVVLLAGERYQALPEALDLPSADESVQTRLLIVEGNSPDSIKRRLEKLTKNRHAFRVLYSHHRPTLTEAINMAMAHVTTPYVFFLTSDARFLAGNLRDLVQSALSTDADIVTPLFSEKNGGFPLPFPWGPDAPYLDPRAFLAKKSALARLGHLEELDWRLAGVDLAFQVKNVGLRWVCSPEASVSTAPTAAACQEDLELAGIQWSDSSAKTAFQIIHNKWPLNFSQDHYIKWVMGNRVMCISSIKKGIGASQGHGVSGLYSLARYGRLLLKVLNLWDRGRRTKGIPVNFVF